MVYQHRSDPCWSSSDDVTEVVGESLDWVKSGIGSETWPDQAGADDDNLTYILHTDRLTGPLSGPGHKQEQFLCHFERTGLRSIFLTESPINHR